MKRLNKNVRVALGVIYVIFFTYLLFFAGFRDGTSTEVNLIPFRTTRILIVEHYNYSSWYMYAMILGNILLLLPIPIIFSLDWRKARKWLFILGVPVAIEVLQYAFQVGSADIDDVIFNASGCAVGFWLRKRKY